MSALESYKISREQVRSNPRQEMLREKKLHVESLYELAVDREDTATLNGKKFVKSPRLFNRKIYDTVHQRIDIETIDEHDRFETGDYVQFEDCEWLCINSYVFHGLYCRGTLQKCNQIIRWQNPITREIIERPVFMSNSTKYGTGEDAGGKVIVIQTAQHMIQVGCDSETILIDSPIRFMLDKNKVTPSVYKVTQNDNTTPNYGSKGICNITMLQDALNPETDNIELGICDYIAPTLPSGSDNQNAVLSHIEGRTDLRIGYARTYTVYFESEVNGFEWAIDSEIAEKLSISYSDDNSQITILATDKQLIDKNFELQVVVDGSISSAITIHIEDLF